MTRINNNELLLEEFVRERLIALEYICRSREIRELMARLEKEHGAYPQTTVTIEEE